MSIQIIPGEEGQTACAVAVLPSVDTPPVPTSPLCNAFLLPSQHVQVAAFVPIYTEDAYTLKRTLQHLTLQQEDMRKCYRSYLQNSQDVSVVHMDMARHAAPSSGIPDNLYEPALHVLVVVDGIEKVSSSMAAYLHEMFPVFTEDFFAKWSETEKIHPAAKRFTCFDSPNATSPTPLAPRVALFHRAVIAEDEVRFNPLAEHAPHCKIAPVDIDVTWALKSKARESDRSLAVGAADSDEAIQMSLSKPVRPLYITLLVKERNRKKHNSQRWFFDLFAKLCARKCGSQFYFATDCGTTYSPHLLCELLGHMHNHPRCGACCGHQRIMPYADQADPGLGERLPSESWSQWALRCIQGADFDQGLCVFNGVHSKMGFLPVIPGPCGLFRVSCLTDDMLDEMNAVCTNPTEKDGLIQGNLKLAEDRILSYLLILRARGQAMASTDWVPTAVFYFEAEETLRELVLQRRRWLNGTIMGYPWVLMRPELWGSMIHTSGARSFQAIAMFLLCLVQLLVFFVVAALPAFVGIVGHLTIMSVAVLVRYFDGTINEVAMLAIIQLYWVLYGGSWLLLVFTARMFTQPYFHAIWVVRTAINASIIIVNSISMVTLFAISIAEPAGLAKIMGEAPFTIFQLAFCAGLLYLSTPFALALMHSREAFTSLARKFYIYYAFLPTVVVDFMSYSAARLDDWTWGNKERPINARAASNAALVPLNDQKMTSTMWRTKLFAQLIPLIIVVGNCVATGFTLYFALISDFGLIIIGGIFELIGLTIMSCASVYFLLRFLHRPIMTLMSYLSWGTCFAAVIGIITVYDRSSVWYGRFMLGFCASMGVLWGLAFLEMMHDKFCSVAESIHAPQHRKKEHSASVSESLKAIARTGDGIAVSGIEEHAPRMKVSWWAVVLCLLVFPISPIVLLLVFGSYVLRDSLRSMAARCRRRGDNHNFGSHAVKKKSRLRFSGSEYQLSAVRRLSVHTGSLHENIPVLRTVDHIHAATAAEKPEAGGSQGIEAKETHRFLNSNQTVVIISPVQERETSRSLLPPFADAAGTGVPSTQMASSEKTNYEHSKHSTVIVHDTLSVTSSQADAEGVSNDAVAEHVRPQARTEPAHATVKEGSISIPTQQIPIPSQPSAEMSVAVKTGGPSRTRSVEQEALLAPKEAKQQHAVPTKEDRPFVEASVSDALHVKAASRELEGAKATIPVSVAPPKPARRLSEVVRSVSSSDVLAAMRPQAPVNASLLSSDRDAIKPVQNKHTIAISAQPGTSDASLRSRLDHAVRSASCPDVAPANTRQEMTSSTSPSPHRHSVSYQVVHDGDAKSVTMRVGNSQPAAAVRTSARVDTLRPDTLPNVTMGPAGSLQRTASQSQLQVSSGSVAPALGAPKPSVPIGYSLPTALPPPLPPASHRAKVGSAPAVGTREEMHSAATSMRSRELLDAAPPAGIRPATITKTRSVSALTVSAVETNIPTAPVSANTVMAFNDFVQADGAWDRPERRRVHLQTPSKIPVDSAIAGFRNRVIAAQDSPVHVPAALAPVPARATTAYDRASATSVRLQMASEPSPVINETAAAARQNAQRWSVISPAQGMAEAELVELTGDDRHNRAELLEEAGGVAVHEKPLKLGRLNKKTLVSSAEGLAGTPMVSISTRESARSGDPATTRYRDRWVVRAADE